MKYAILKIVNGTFLIDSEWGSNIEGAIVQFHDVCRVLWNAQDVESATVAIIDQNNGIYNDYREFINHQNAQV